GEIAGRVAAQCSRDGAFDTSHLWPYNVEFMRTLGREIAIQDAFRRFLWSLTNAEIKFLVDNSLINEHDLVYLYVGGKYSGEMTTIIKKFFRILPHITSLNLTSRAISALLKTRTVARLYEQ